MDPLIARLLATEAMTGPYRRTRPIASSLWQRIARAARVFFTNRKGSKQ